MGTVLLEERNGDSTNTKEQQQFSRYVEEMNRTMLE
jgi:hypothetical protein